MPNPDHDVVLHLIDPTTVVAQIPGTLIVGQTVRYSSPSGTVRVVFPAESPYPVTEVHDSEVHTLTQAGRFGFRCFVKPHGATDEVGWSPAHPKSGGDHDVLPSGSPPPPPAP